MKTKSSKKRRKKHTPNSKKSNKTVTKNSSGFFHRYLSKDSILTIVTILSLIFGLVQCRQSAKIDKENRTLLENLVTDKYGKDLQEKYPSGYALFGVNHSRTFKNESIPHRSNLLEEYEFDWSPVRISKVTETTVTVEMPHIHYKPLNTKLFGTAMIIPKSPKGQFYIYPLKPKGTKNRIFIELIEYNDPFYAFAIGFKPE